MRKRLITLLIFLFPTTLIRPLLFLLGCKLGKGSKIGFSIINSNQIKFGEGVRIGHLNYIKVNKIRLEDNAYINHLNILKGPFSLHLKRKAAIGKLNIITRARIGITYGHSELSLGNLTKINSFHFLDLTNSIVIGDHSTLAGIRSQIWTHGYVHETNDGPNRFRVDGKVIIGNNVYIGSNVFVNPGVQVCDEIHIGGNSNISKSLVRPGMYVNQRLRWLERNSNDIKASLEKNCIDTIIEPVYVKNLDEK